MNIYDQITKFGWAGLSDSAAQAAGGDIFYVDGNSGNKANTAVSGQGASWDMPFANINYAISRCSNNAGNIILVAADHTETIADTNASNVSGTTTDEFAIAILTGDESNNITIENCKFMAGGQAAVVAIDLVKDTDHTTIRNCVFTGAYSTCVIRGQTTASTYLDIGHNIFMTTGATDTFNLVAASTGMIHDNRIVMNAANAAAAMDVGNCWLMNNYLVADDDVTGAKAGLIDNAFASVTVTADDA